MPSNGKHSSASALPHYLREGRHSIRFFDFFSDSAADDWYKGMFIPKGTTVYIPVYAIHHTERFYNNPDRFNPDRYEGYMKLANDYAGAPDFARRDHYGYGAGRRICPGVHLAERNMWRIAAKLLWAFEFSQVEDPTTGEVFYIDTHAYTPGIAQFPLPFKVQIKPRSDKHIELIKTERENAEDSLRGFS